MYNSPQCFYICCRIWKWMRNNSLRAAVLSRFLLLEVCLDNVLSQTLHTLILGWFLNKLYGLPYYTLFMHINLSREVVCGNSFLMLAYLTGGLFFFLGGGGVLLYVTLDAFHCLFSQIFLFLVCLILLQVLRFWEDVFCIQGFFTLHSFSRIFVHLWHKWEQDYPIQDPRKCLPW